MRTLLCSSSIPVEPLVFCLLFWFWFLFTTSTSYGKNTWAGAGRPREREIPPPPAPCTITGAASLLWRRTLLSLAFRVPFVSVWALMF